MTETAGNDRQDDLLGAALRLTASMAGEENVVALLRQGLSLCIKVLTCDRSLLIAESADGAAEIIVGWDIQQASAGVVRDRRPVLAAPQAWAVFHPLANPRDLGFVVGGAPADRIKAGVDMQTFINQRIFRIVLQQFFADVIH